MADGYIVFQGTIRAASRFFNINAQFSSKCVNPADLFMKLLTINYPKSQVDEAKIDRFARVYRKTL